MNRYAYLIGCDDYKNFSRISFCQADMTLMQETLVNYCDYDYKNMDCSIQYPECRETPDIIYGKLQNIIKQMDKGDSLLFYFAGHGVKEEDKGYLLLADSKSSNYAETALDLGKINELLRNKNINGFLIIDACHSGILARNAFNSTVIDIISDTGCITLASCSENEESHPYPKMEQGVFTFFLCEEIKKISIETPVLIEQLKINVCIKVAEWARDNYKKQTPTLIGQIVGNQSIAIRNHNEFGGVITMTDEEIFISHLKKLEEEFFNRCYCVNLELGKYEEDAVIDNYTIAQELCWELVSRDYEIMDGWDDTLVKMKYYLMRITENKNLGISADEQYNVLEEINRFVDSIPYKFDERKKTLHEKVGNEISAKQIVQNNISNVLLNFATKVEETMDVNAEKSTDEILSVESPALYLLVLKQWLKDNTQILISRVMSNNNEWRVFGKYYVYLAYDQNDTPWIIMVNILKKYNYSNVLHAFNNLHEIKNYYSKFGKEYKYQQIVIISQGKEKELEKMISKQTKIRRLYNNNEVLNSVMYLKAGRLNLVSSNYIDKSTNNI